LAVKVGHDFAAFYRRHDLGACARMCVCVCVCVMYTK